MELNDHDREQIAFWQQRKRTASRDAEHNADVLATCLRTRHPDVSDAELGRVVGTLLSFAGLCGREASSMNTALLMLTEAAGLALLDLTELEQAEVMP